MVEDILAVRESERSIHRGDMHVDLGHVDYSVVVWDEVASFKWLNLTCAVIVSVVQFLRAGL